MLASNFYFKQDILEFHVLGVAEFESAIRFLKFKMADLPYKNCIVFYKKFLVESIAGV